jgi:hypothetical protein
MQRLLGLVEENVARLHRLEEQKLLQLMDLLLDQVFNGSQFEKRVVEAFTKFCGRGTYACEAKKSINGFIIHNRIAN